MKRLTAALIVILLLGAGLAVSAHILIDRSTLKEDVIAAVKRQTGRDLIMARFSVGVLPWPYFSARDVVLRGRQGTLDEPTLEARDIRASIALLPLLWREIRLENLTIGHGRVFLGRDRQGVADWEFAAPVSQPSAVTGPGSHPAAHWALRIGSAKLDQVRFDLNDLYAHRSGTVTIDRAEFDGLSASAPYLDIHGRHGTTPFRVNGHVGPLTLFQGKNPPWAVSLGATMGDDSKPRDWLNLDGQITDTRHLRGFSGVLRGELASLKDLQTLFPRADLPAIDGLGGEIGIYDADPGSADIAAPLRSATFSDTLARLGVNHLHLHMNGAPSWRGLSFGALHADADTLSSALTLSATIEHDRTALALQGRFGTLAQAGTAWQSGLVTPLSVAVDIRDANQLAGAGLKAHLAGEIGLKNASLVLEGQARKLAVMQTALNEVAIKGRFGRDSSGAVTVDDLSFTSHEAAGTIALKADAPLLSAVDGKVHFDRLDLDALSGLWLGQTQAGSVGSAPGAPPAIAAPLATPAPAATSPSNQGEIPGAGASAAQGGEKPTHAPALIDLGAFVAHGRGALDLSADSVHFNGADYSHVSGQVALGASKVTLESIRGEGNGISLSGHALYDTSSNPALVRVSFSPLLVPATLAQTMLGMPDLFRGPLMLVGQIEARGDTRPALRESMAGTLGLSMVGGSIDASKLGPYLGDAARAVLSHRELGVRCLGVHARFGQGQAQMDTIAMEAGALSLAGHGTVGLNQGTLDLHLLPRIGFGGTGASTPVAVAGTLDAPQAHQEANASGRFQITIGGSEADACPEILGAAREGIAGENAAAPRKRSQAAELLHGLGILH